MYTGEYCRVDPCGAKGRGCWLDEDWGPCRSALRLDGTGLVVVDKLPAKYGGIRFDLPCRKLGSSRTQ